MTTCLWRSWEARSDLEAHANVSQDVRARVAAFLTAVLAAIDDLAARLPDATNDDLIAVLGPHVLWLSGPEEARMVEALAGLVVPRLVAALDSLDAGRAAEARLRTWLLVVTHALEGKALAVQWAIVAVFLDRVLRARLTGPAGDDSDGLDDAAEGSPPRWASCCGRSARGRSRPRRTTSCEGTAARVDRPDLRIVLERRHGDT